MDAGNCALHVTTLRAKVLACTLITVAFGIASLDAHARNFTTDEKATEDTQLRLSQADKEIALGTISPGVRLPPRTRQSARCCLSSMTT